MARRDGAALAGWTSDVGLGGMCVGTALPLDVGELVAFELVTTEGLAGTGHARVAWRRWHETYGLRFEHMTTAALDLVR